MDGTACHFDASPPRLFAESKESLSRSRSGAMPDPRRDQDPHAGGRERRRCSALRSPRCAASRPPLARVGHTHTSVFGICAFVSGERCALCVCVAMRPCSGGGGACVQAAGYGYGYRYTYGCRCRLRRGTAVIRALARHGPGHSEERGFLLLPVVSAHNRRAAPAVRA